MTGAGITAMELSDILPDRFNYDKMRPPRLEGQPAKVFNHLTVMGLDSINENSMVNIHGYAYMSSRLPGSPLFASPVPR